MKRSMWLALVLLATSVALADDAARPAPDPNNPETRAKEQVKQEQVKEETKAGPDAEAGEPQTEEEEKAGEEAAGAAQESKDQGPKAISGMSILGNQEAPKSLVIVPWKTSEIGDAFGFSTMLDDSRQPVDREVFLRELSYYQVRSKTTP